VKLGWNVLHGNTFRASSVGFGVVAVPSAFFSWGVMEMIGCSRVLVAMVLVVTDHVAFGKVRSCSWMKTSRLVPNCFQGYIRDTSGY